MMAQWYLALSNPRVQALRLQQTGRKNGRNVAIIAPLYQLPAQEAGAPIRTYHDRIVDGMVNLIHLAGISNFTVEDTQILQPVADAQTIARLEQGASKKANKEDKEFHKNWRKHMVRPDLVVFFNEIGGYQGDNLSGYQGDNLSEHMQAQPSPTQRGARIRQHQLPRPRPAAPLPSPPLYTPSA